MREGKWPIDRSAARAEIGGEVAALLASEPLLCQISERKLLASRPVYPSSMPRAPPQKIQLGSFSEVA